MSTRREFIGLLLSVSMALVFAGVAISGHGMAMPGRWSLGGSVWLAWVMALWCGGVAVACGRKLVGAARRKRSAQVRQRQSGVSDV